MATQPSGTAAEFWFFSKLLQLGYEAYITFGNTKAIDVSSHLSNGILLTFNVKGKKKFGGSFLDFDKKSFKKNHFFVFVDLQTHPDKITKEVRLGNAKCFIVESLNLNKIAADWKSNSSETTGFGFIAPLLYYLKEKDETRITINRKKEFKRDHKIKEIDFAFYDKIIMTLEEFEKKYFRYKL